MKLFIIILFTSNIASAGDMSCSNLEGPKSKDELSFSLEYGTSYAYYFDGDDTYSLSCEATKDDGLICEDDGITVILYESGEAYVDNGVDPEVDFSCY